MYLDQVYMLFSYLNTAQSTVDDRFPRRTTSNCVFSSLLHIDCIVSTHKMVGSSGPRSSCAQTGVKNSFGAKVVTYLRYQISKRHRLDNSKGSPKYKSFQKLFTLKTCATLDLIDHSLPWTRNLQKL